MTDNDKKIQAEGAMHGAFNGTKKDKLEAIDGAIRRALFDILWQVAPTLAQMPEVAVTWVINVANMGAVDAGMVKDLAITEVAVINAARTRFSLTRPFEIVKEIEARINEPEIIKLKLDALRMMLSAI